MDSNMEADLVDCCYYTICTCQILRNDRDLLPDWLGSHAWKSATVHNCQCW